MTTTGPKNNGGGDNKGIWQTFLQVAGSLPAPLAFILLVLFVVAVLGFSIDGNGFWLLLILPAIGLLAWAWQQYLNKVGDHEEPELPGEDTPPPPESRPQVIEPAGLEKQYLTRLARQCEFLSLKGIDKAATQADSATLALQKVFTRLDVRAQPHEKKEHERGGAQPDMGEKREAALQAVSREKCLVLLGKPGSGKSTLVNFIAFCLAGQEVRSDIEGLEQLADQGWTLRWLLPVRVILRDYAARGLATDPQKTLWSFIEAELAHTSPGQPGLAAYAGPLWRHLQKRGGLLLLDGLDEVPDAHQWREQLRQEILNFVEEFPRVRLLVTSRPYAYSRPEWQLPGFARTELLDFNLEQIDCYIDHRYEFIGRQATRPLEQEQAQRYAEGLKEQIRRRRALRELAERPLLLALITSLHHWRGGGTLPQDREQLYDQSVELLLDLWQRRKQIPLPDGRESGELTQLLGVNQDELRLALSEVAFNVHKEQPHLQGTADIRAGRLAEALYHLIPPDKSLNTKQIIRYIKDRAGLLEEREAPERGKEIYAFVHRTFQEYLAGCHLLKQDDFADLSADLARPDPERWREALLLAVKRSESPSPVWDLVEALCPEDLPQPGTGLAEEAWQGAILAGEVILERELWRNPPARRQERLWRVRDWSTRLITEGRLTAPDRATAGRALARIGDERPEVMRVDEMLFCLVPSGVFYIGEGERIHEVDVPYDYWMGRYPVTNAQFGEFVQDGGYKEARYWSAAQEAKRWQDGQFEGRARPYDWGFPFNLPNHPVVGITWYEAAAFACWLTERWQARGVLPEGREVRLPSEIEWEKGARGGLDIVERPVVATLNGYSVAAAPSLVENPFPKRDYPWGDEAISPDRANYNETGIGATSSVGCFPRGTSPYGCEEMAGNVWEWTDSWYDEDKDSRVVRGGSWSFARRYARVPGRYDDHPDLADSTFGFRLVAPVSGS